MPPRVRLDLVQSHPLHKALRESTRASTRRPSKRRWPRPTRPRRLISPARTTSKAPKPSPNAGSRSGRTGSGADLEHLHLLGISRPAHSPSMAMAPSGGSLAALFHLLIQGKNRCTPLLGDRPSAVICEKIRRTARQRAPKMRNRHPMCPQRG